MPSPAKGERVPSRRKKESDASSLESLLKSADASEVARITELLTKLEQLAEEEQQPPANREHDAVIAKTRAEAARLLGVSERTISAWATDPTFPGKSGDAGARNGHFPIGAIRQWCAAQAGGGADAAAEEDGRKLRLWKLAIDVADRQVDLEAKRGVLVSADDMRSRLVDLVGGMRSVIEELGDRLVIELRPKTVGGRRRVRQVGERVAKHALEAISDLVTRVFADNADDTAGRVGDTAEAQAGTARPAGSPRPKSSAPGA